MSSSQTTLHQLFDAGQSVWCDHISRRILDSGELQRRLDQGVVGVTSNPTIFMKAITGTTDYDARLVELLNGERDGESAYEGLAVPDIADTADLLRPIHDRTDGQDGYISLEVNPHLAYDAAGTIEQARRLFRTLNRPNLMIKVPGTDECLPAVRQLITEGINVNVTLIFGLEQYERVIDAYLGGLEDRRARGGRLDQVSSVASFFVSRVDTAVDDLLRSRQAPGVEVDALFGRAAVANAQAAYARFLRRFAPQGWFEPLRKSGARVQRPLWASTSTKDPSYPDTYYVDALVAPQTVNTMPPVTIDAVLDHGRTSCALTHDDSEAQALFAKLSGLSIDVHEVARKLCVDGVELFARSFDELLEGLRGKSRTLRPVG